MGFQTSSSSFCLYVFPILFLCILFVSGERNNDRHHVTSLDSLFTSENCSSATGDDPSLLKVFHAYGPCSPFGRESRLDPLLMIQLDQIRVRFLQSKGNSNFSNSSEDLLLGKTKITVPPVGSFDPSSYVVTVGIGTPRQSATLAFDTGSDLTWTQCQPCLGSCYSQRERIFDPSRSSTYSNISCNSPACLLAQTATRIPTGCLTDTCVYRSVYGDKSSSVGFLATDTLALTPNDVFPNYVLGCGQRNQGLFVGIAGLLGLGRTQLSLISQTAIKYGRLFSYCLPSTSSSTGYLSFGPIDTPLRGVSFTPLLTGSVPNFYYLNLVRITVGGQTVPIPPTVFSGPGTIIDSGTVISRLPPTAYSALRTAFRQQMSQYPLGQPFEILDTCYDLRGFTTIFIPKVVLGFAGADLNVASRGTLLVFSPSQVCLAFAGNANGNDFGIIGNIQQRTIQVVYDLAEQRIGFTGDACV